MVSVVDHNQILIVPSARYPRASVGISVRKFLAILGGISAAVLILLAVGIGVVAWNGTALDKDSRSYVDVAVPAIVAHWSPDELLRRATPELRASAKPD